MRSVKNSSTVGGGHRRLPDARLQPARANRAGQGMPRRQRLALATVAFTALTVTGLSKCEPDAQPSHTTDPVAPAVTYNSGHMNRHHDHGRSNAALTITLGRYHEVDGVWDGTVIGDLYKEATQRGICATAAGVAALSHQVLLSNHFIETDTSPATEETIAEHLPDETTFAVSLRDLYALQTTGACA